MGLALTTTLAFCLWVTLWALGVGGFDGFMVTVVIILVAATVKGVLKLLPGIERPKGPRGSSGW